MHGAMAGRARPMHDITLSGGAGLRERAPTRRSARAPVRCQPGVGSRIFGCSAQVQPLFDAVGVGPAAPAWPGWPVHSSTAWKAPDGCPRCCDRGGCRSGCYRFCGGSSVTACAYLVPFVTSSAFLPSECPRQDDGPDPHIYTGHAVPRTLAHAAESEGTELPSTGGGCPARPHDTEGPL